MSFDIVDFHTHPFTSDLDNICPSKEYCNMSPENTKEFFGKLGVNMICGAVIALDGTLVRNGINHENYWQKIKANNEAALELKKLYGDFYTPGFHIHPDFVKESCEEIEKMSKKGVKIIGELVPYLDGWDDTCYANKNYFEILDTAKQYNMIVNVHSMAYDTMDKMVDAFPDVTFVAAHPGELDDFLLHVERMKKSENYYIDLSGWGIHRHGLLRRAVDMFGPERFLYGSDFPTCNPAMYLGGVLLDPLITDKEKELILGKNARRLLGL